ncbi:MAG: glycoside hydrolase family 28 protein [Clostridia bacterium]|nr:glycoside hydrolase family 28 protein [Clostridia bacterium]
MYNAKPVKILSRCATFELETDTCFNAPSEFKIFLGGDEIKACSRNIFTLYNLSPAMSYNMRLSNGDGTDVSVSFVTKNESLLIDASRFGAVGDGETDCTSALSAAIAACPKDGTVYVPKGVYKTYPLFLKSDMTLYLDDGAVLLGGVERSHYPVLPGTIQTEHAGEKCLGTWEGNPLDCYAALITALGAKNVAVAGQGIVDGNAQNADWWINVRQRKGAWRPRTMFFSHCDNVSIVGVTVQNSPSWTVHPHYSDNVDALDILIKNPDNSPNTDGFDPESCANVCVLGAVISVGDDCMAVKSGKMYMAENHWKPTENMQVRNCLLERGHGAVVVGSECAGGVNGLKISQCLMENTDRGLRVKTRRGRGERCVLTNISFENIEMHSVLTPFAINTLYCCDPDGKSDYVASKQPQPVDKSTPTIGTVFCRDIKCDGCGAAGAYIFGLPEKPVESVTLENVSISFAPDAKPAAPVMMRDIEPVCRLGFYAENVSQLTLKNVIIEGADGEPMRLVNVKSFEKE